MIGIATRAGTLIAGAPSLEPRVAIFHEESGICGAASFDTSGHNVLEDTAHSGWARYVSWGWAGMIGSIHKGTRSGRSGSCGSGAKLMVSGNLPRAAGLASSSSLVTASAIMAARMNRTRLGREELALVAAEGERVGAGTRGGAVDHTVSMCAAKSKAVHVSFTPKLETSTMPVPGSASFVVVNSGVHAFKGQHDGTKMLFNTRVIECRVGSALVARRLRTHLALSVSTPGQLYNAEKSGEHDVATMSDLIRRVGTVLGADEWISVAEAAAELDLRLDSAEWKDRFLLGLEGFEPSAALRIGRRLSHVFGEARRVEQFQSILGSSAVDDQSSDASASSDACIIRRLGEILSESHASLRDLYECSAREVDELVEFCLASGSAGSRIIGAGWGGCTLSLVSDKKLGSFLSKLRNRCGDEAVFVAKPCEGAYVLSL